MNSRGITACMCTLSSESSDKNTLIELLAQLNAAQQKAVEFCDGRRLL